MPGDLGTLRGHLELEIDSFKQGAEGAKREIESFKNEANKASEKVSLDFEKIGKKISDVGKRITLGITTPIAGMVAAITHMGSEFDAKMSKVQAISQASAEDFERLREKAKELGATTVFSASQVAEGMSEMAKAGWGTEQILVGMEGVLNAASASGESLANVSTIVADAITGFGLAAEDATMVADLLTQAANSGTIDINDLGESFKYIAPVAGALGISITEVTTALAAMSQAGIKGSQAGTSLRTILARMAKPTDQVEEAMNELGITIANDDGTFKSLNEIIGILRGSFDGLTEEQKAYYATTLAGQEGMSGLLSLLKLTEEEYDALTASMADSAGVAKQTSEVMLDNLNGKITLLKSGIEGLAIQFNDILKPIMLEAVDKVQNIVNKLASLSEEEKTQILKIGAIAAAVGPVLIVVGKVISTIAKVSSSLSAVGKVIGGLTAGPVAGIIAAIGAMVLAFVDLMKNNEEFKSNMIAVWEKVKSSVDNFLQTMKDLGINFESITGTLSTIWEKFCNLLAPVFETAIGTLGDILSTVFDTLSNLLNIFKDAFSGDWEKLWEDTKKLFNDMWDGIASSFDRFIKFGKDIIVNIKEGLELAWESLKSKAKEIIDSVIDIMRKPISKVKDIGRDIVNGIKDGISDKWGSFKSSTKEKFDGLVDDVKSWLGIHSPSKVFKEEVGEQIPAGISDGIDDEEKGLISVTRKVLESTLEEAKNKVKSDFKEVGTLLVQAITSGINEAESLLVSAVNGLSETVLGVLENLINQAASMVANVLSMVAEAAKSLEELQSLNAKIAEESSKASASESASAKTQFSFADNPKATNTGYASAPKVSTDIKVSPNGNTFIFNSPKALNEITAAEVMKRTMRDMSEGF